MRLCASRLVVFTTNPHTGFHLHNKTNQKEQASQKQKRLLFHGLIRLWLRNSVLRTSNSRSHGRLISSHRIT